jgi:hypothetical protein
LTVPSSWFFFWITTVGWPASAAWSRSIALWIAAASAGSLVAIRIALPISKVGCANAIASKSTSL